MKTYSRKFNRVERRRSGQTLVETAAVLIIVLIPMTLGIMQFGVVLNATNTLTQLAREGARYASVHGTENGADAAIRAYIQAAAAGTSIKAADIPDANITISMLGGKPRASGNPIQVDLKYPMSKKIFVGSILPGIASLKQDYIAQATFVLE